MLKTFYITTTLPYVNADPHIGFALELVHADIIARYKRLQGCEVFFNTGTDEHGSKVYQAALKEGKEPKAYADALARRFEGLREPLGLLSELNFIRTTDSHHVKAAQEFWKRCAASGDIYKKSYKLKYCVGCELEKTDSELEDSRCPIHPTLTLEVREEENYFFRLSKYQEKLLALYDERPDFVVPDFRLNEIRALIREKGLEDFSISRLKSKMPWGVPVPDDDTHVMYVWFDALVSYISAIGWSTDVARFEKWWPVTQFAGKDQVRQQAVMWQAMLLSAGLPPSRQIVIHGFIQSGGEKMSKSLGNVIDPVAIVNEYGTDALRFYLARHIHPFEDSDFTMDKFKEAYNADLANGIGNLVSRVMKMAIDYGVKKPYVWAERNEWYSRLDEEIGGHMRAYSPNLALEKIMLVCKAIDGTIAEKKPYNLIKTVPEEAREVVAVLLAHLDKIAVWLEPFMPVTSKKMKDAIGENKKPENLFPRK
jgi:methionyl-tRNA synthetase